MPLRISDLSCYALSFCAAGAMLAGCGGSTQVPNPTAQAPAGNAISANSSGNEVLSGKAKLIKPCHTIRGPHGGKHGSITTFNAHGNATGPFPGTFTASGGWTLFDNLLQRSWTFAETFTITTKSSTISGTMKDIGFSYLPFSCTVVEKLTVPYTSGSVSGSALISIIQKQDFGETLDGL